MFANNTKSGAGNVTQGEVEKESYPFVGGWGGGENRFCTVSSGCSRWRQMPAFASDLLFGPSVLCCDWLDVCNALCFLAVGFRLNIFPWLSEMFYACFQISSSPFPGARNDFFLTRRNKYWLEISKAQERLKMSELYHSSKSTQSLYIKLTAIFRGWVFHILLPRDCDN